MNRSWTFGQKLAVGFTIPVVLVALMCVMVIYALSSVVRAKDKVVREDARNLVDIKTLGLSSARKVGAVRGYLLSAEARYLDDMREHRALFLRTMGVLRERVDTEAGRRLLERVELLEKEHQAASEELVAERQRNLPSGQLAAAFEERLQPKRRALIEAMDALSSEQEQALEQAVRAATERAGTAQNNVLALAAAVALLSLLAAYLLTRALSRQIGGAVGQVQSSSAELQAAANQQASGAKEQATAMNEIATTINELVLTARQIAESAQRVAQIAQQATSATSEGSNMVERGREAIAAIKRQVDLIVAHMLELGKRSQQIGAVLDIVAELAEQTNILAINATIEAAGAGEAGKRFAVVAEEIRKLADRVTTSAKEIRGLIEDVRRSVNTTVMTTESGAKAAEAGSARFGDVAVAFSDIANLVGTASEAAKEIELSTKQQTTAVEQVNIAIANVSQATRETEASSTQTLQTVSQLASLSRELLRLVRSERA